jgi:hypothetical protein
LFVACARDNVSVINLLLKHAQQQRKLAFLGVRDGSYESSAQVVALDDYVHTVDHSGRSVVFVACQYNQLATVRLLCKQSEYLELLNLPRIDGDTPLAVACRYGYRELIKCLLGLCSSESQVLLQLDTANALGDTALHCVCRRQLVDLAALLIENGASTSLLNDDGLVALAYITDPIDRQMLQKAGLWGNSRSRQGFGMEHWVGSCGYSIYMIVESGLDSLRQPHLLPAPPLLSALGWGGLGGARTGTMRTAASSSSGSPVSQTASPLSAQQSASLDQHE